METIRAIVKSVLVIIMTAAFLEIVLPRSDIKRYINLIIGLFVVIAVLNPFLEVIHRELTFDVFDRAAVPESETRAIISKGRQMAAGQKSRAARQYKEKLTKQITALAALYPNARVKRVEIDMVEDTTDPNFGQVKRITLYSSGPAAKESAAGGTGTPVVDEVRIAEIGAGTGQPGGPAVVRKKDDGPRKLQEMIANFYGLTPEQVAVQN